MTKYANHPWNDIYFRVGDLIWLSSEHLSLPSLLNHKLAATFIGPYEVTKVINPVAYYLAVLLTWKIHDVLYFS